MKRRDSVRGGCDERGYGPRRAGGCILRRAKKPVLLVANKTDNHELQYNAPEFYSLGLGDPYCISAVTGSGTGDMMDLIVSKFKKESDEILDEDIPRFAVVGRPNAGNLP